MLNIPLTPEVKQLLAALGFKHTHHPASWRDIGSAENGPKLHGYDSYDEYNKGAFSVYVQDEMIKEVEEEYIPPHTPL